MYNECYMDNTIHTTYRVSWTITSHAFDFHTSLIHVNILCTNILTSTYSMSLYVQVMTHAQSSHVMAICTSKLITCQYIRTHILTSKHVTLSQAMMLSNKAYNGLKQATNNHKLGHEHRPQTVTGSPRRSLPSPRQGKASPRRTRKSPFPVLELDRCAFPRLGKPLHLGEHHLCLGKDSFFLETSFPRLGKAQLS